MIRPIQRLLVANRGEIAVRIFRTAHRMGIETVAVCSEADEDAAHVRAADDHVVIGPPPARESYLDAERILAAAKETGADAIHPGYGFLSENAAFAEAVIAAGLIWVGPPPAAIRAMGLKDAAKALMQAAGVPVTPGYLGESQDPTVLAREAERIGYPVLIKAVAGGGGKGMRLVRTGAEFEAALASCRREAAASFGDDRVILETYVARPRHIEVQVFADSHGNAVHLFERDCSLQRRHQKVIEEAPAPGMDAATRAAITEAAVRAAKAVAYEGAGTIEFIADASEGLRPDRIWFMEMNTRLQVEHPVTEAVTGLDLVEWQLRVAMGEPLPLPQDAIRLNGHAVEARLYAENPPAGFLPSTGELSHLRLPDRVRVDTGVAPLDWVTPYYDPMIAKLIAHAETREAAIAQLGRACLEVEVWPVHTNAAFLLNCLETPDFVAGDVDTGLIERNLATLAAPHAPSPTALAVAAQAVVTVAQSEDGPWGGDLPGFRLNAEPDPAVRLFLDGQAMLAAPGEQGRRSALIDEDGSIVVFERGAAIAFAQDAPEGLDEADGDGTIRSPMPGKVTLVAVQAGQAVEQGQLLMVLEAMKMEHSLATPVAGVVEELLVSEGGQTTEGAVLARIVPA